MAKCSVCGYDYVEVWYNKRISETYQGVREIVTYCNYCRTTTSKREVI
jgi:hypothetical protein